MILIGIILYWIVYLLIQSENSCEVFVEPLLDAYELCSETYNTTYCCNHETVLAFFNTSIHTIYDGCESTCSIGDNTCIGTGISTNCTNLTTKKYKYMDGLDFSTCSTCNNGYKYGNTVQSSCYNLFFGNAMLPGSFVLAGMCKDQWNPKEVIA